MADDLISRQSLIEQLSDWVREQTVSKYITSADCKAIRSGAILALDMVDKAPAVDAAEVVRGRWLINSDGYYPYCSECKEEPKSGIMTHYCPNCGAKMDKVNET